MIDMPMTPEERAWRRREQSAKRKNEKREAEAAAVPLFAEQVKEIVPEFTAANEFWHWRRNRASAGEHGGYLEARDGLVAFQIRVVIERYVRAVLGEEVFAKLLDKCKRTYPSVSYWYEFWKKVMCGELIELAIEKNPDFKPGCGMKAIRVTDSYQHQHMTPAEFYAMFPYAEATLPDDFAFELDPLGLRR